MRWSFRDPGPDLQRFSVDKNFGLQLSTTSLWRQYPMRFPWLCLPLRMLSTGRLSSSLNLTPVVFQSMSLLPRSRSIFKGGNLLRRPVVQPLGLLWIQQTSNQFKTSTNLNFQMFPNWLDQGSAYAAWTRPMPRLYRWGGAMAMK